MKDCLEIIVAEHEVWAEQLKGQNLRMRYLADSNHEDLVKSGEAFRRGAKLAAESGIRFAPEGRNERTGFATNRKVVARELNYLAEWCEAESGRTGIGA